MFTSFSDKYVT